MLDGNQETALRNGVRIFPAMLDAIAGAERRLTFETFVYWSGEIADRFAAALAAKARAGVKVQVLMDGFGCDCTDGDAIRLMLPAAVPEGAGGHGSSWPMKRAGHRVCRRRTGSPPIRRGPPRKS